MPKSKKRLVPIQEDLHKEVMEAARNEGKSIGTFIEESLRQTVSASKLGYTPEKAAEFLKVTCAHRILGGAFVPLDVLNHLVSSACQDQGGHLALQEKWYESGRWHGKYLKEKLEDPVETFKTFLEATRWDLNEVEVKREGDTVKLRCVSTVMTEEATELLLKYVEGALHGIGYETEKNDHMKGIIIFEFKRQPSPPQP